MGRSIISILLVLTLCQFALASETVVQDFGQQHLFFPETQVALKFSCDDKTQVNWSLESADRKLTSGTAKIRAGVGTVEFKTPPLKDGVMLKLKLTVDGRTEPLILVSPNVFSSQDKWLESLNIVLIDSEDKLVSGIFESNNIPFKTMVDETTRNSLILITNKEISEEYCHWTMQGNHVVVVAPENGDFILPQMNFAINRTFSVSNLPESLFKNQSFGKDAELNREVLCDIQKTSCNAEKWLLLNTKDDKVVLQTFPVNSSNTGWQYACFQFGENRLIYISTPVFDKWETSPTPQLFLKMIIDELRPNESK